MYQERYSVFSLDFIISTNTYVPPVAIDIVEFSLNDPIVIFIYNISYPLRHSLKSIYWARWNHSSVYEFQDVKHIVRCRRSCGWLWQVWLWKAMGLKKSCSIDNIIELLKVTFSMVMRMYQTSKGM